MTVALLLLAAGCKPADSPEREIRLPSGTVDRTFQSASLNRRVTYRTWSRSPFVKGAPIHVLYLLHGNGDSYQTWSASSRILNFVGENTLLVMPEGHSSYFMNSAIRAGDHYEDFLTGDLIDDAERSLPTPPTRGERVILGTSMGGFAAVVIGFKHPGLYGFVGAMSPAIDYAERGFSPLRPGQSMAVRAIFGPVGSATRRASDPFVLAANANPAHVPYLFLSSGDAEPLLEPIRRFDAVLEKRGIAHEFHVVRGGHDWGEWNDALPDLMHSLGQTHSSQ